VKIKPKVEVKMSEVYEVSKVGESKDDSPKMEKLVRSPNQPLRLCVFVF